MWRRSNLLVCTYVYYIFYTYTYACTIPPFYRTSEAFICKISAEDQENKLLDICAAQSADAMIDGQTSEASTHRLASFKASHVEIPIGGILPYGLRGGAPCAWWHLNNREFHFHRNEEGKARRYRVALSVFSRRPKPSLCWVEGFVCVPLTQPGREQPSAC